MLTGYYNDGTATATAGSAAVVGQGTQWKARGYRTGDTFYGKDGKVGLILDVPSDTSITLLMPWGGTTQVAQSYAVQAQAPGVDLDLAVAKLLSSLNNGALAGIADAGSAANKLPYYTGAGQAALADLTAGARALLALAGAADKLPYLTGANTAGLADFKAFGRTLAATADITAARTALQMTDYVRTGKSQADVADADALTQPGQYSVGSTWTGSPFAGASGNNQGYLDHYVWSNDFYMMQVHTQVNSGNHRRFRIKDNGLGGWQAWVELYHSGNISDFYRRSNILGAVAQSGGVPTGAIIERGSNANGTYAKFADGTQLCTMKKTISLNTQAFQDFNYPSAFASNNDISLGAGFDSLPLTGSSVDWWDAASLMTLRIGNAASSWRTLFRGTLSATTGNIYAMALGRWF